METVCWRVLSLVISEGTFRSKRRLRVLELPHLRTLVKHVCVGNLGTSLGQTNVFLGA